MSNKKKVNCIIRLPKNIASAEETEDICAKIWIVLYKWHKALNM